MSSVTIRPITPADDPQIAKIIRENLKAYHLDIPGTVYFDPELDCLSAYYAAQPESRRYFIAENGAGEVIGGVGVAAFPGFANCGEIQKLYLCDSEKGKGLGRRLMETAEHYARQIGYGALYLETHTNLETAIGVYEHLGFRQIEKPAMVQHSTMNRFYWKQL